MLPPETELKTFYQVKSILKKYEAGTLQRISICPNDCIAYWDSSFLPDKYRHAHRSKCPVCDLPRDVTYPKDGKSRPAKVMYFFPIAGFVRSLYARPDVVPFLAQDCDDPHPPEGSIRRSRGWKEKVHTIQHI